MVVGEGPSLPAAMDVNTPACRQGKEGVLLGLAVHISAGQSIEQETL